jgi:cold shock CspA family protein
MTQLLERQTAMCHLAGNQWVQFDVTQGQKGPQAANVHPI